MGSYRKTSGNEFVFEDNSKLRTPSVAISSLVPSNMSSPKQEIPIPPICRSPKLTPAPSTPVAPSNISSPKRDIPIPPICRSPKLTPSPASRPVIGIQIPDTPVEQDRSPSPRFDRQYPHSPNSHRHKKKSHGEDFNNIVLAAMEKAKDLDDIDLELDGSQETSKDNANHWKTDSNVVKHTGGCHCGAVRFEVYASPTPKVIECNCSICVKKQNRHFIVPQSSFKLLKGHDSLKTYSFNTHKAKHIFCSICGVQSFYIPRSNSDGYGIVVHCLNDGTIRKEKVEKFDGKNWEHEIKKKAHIHEYSKEKV